ncbi:MAG: right-handed parallel beta-helix repeat-containing protein [Spirochaetes bacterium]|nr:right-handed parallel beta-helix repeat-containing protein [Spirochaetota bacterium]
MKHGIIRLCLLPIIGMLMSLSVVLGQSDLLLHWKFDEGSGTAVKDNSGNSLDGNYKAGWTDSPSGKAAQFDGTSGTVVSTVIPEDKRFGTKSWTFMTWVKPVHFAIEDKQNQRRIFAYGKYPDAYLVIDIFGVGTVGYYFVFKNDAGKNISAGGGTSVKLALSNWSHIALVCDRPAGNVVIYINGQPQGEAALPPAFTGDFSMSGDLSIGSGWHNYWGAADEVKIFRSALSRDDVRKEFNALKETFGISANADAASIDARETVKEYFAAANAAWAEKRFAAVREACGKAMAIPKLAAHFQSYAQLRSAQSYMAEKNYASAKAEYEKIKANTGYPDVHRSEADECIREIDRTIKGLPAHDAAASRTRIPPIPSFAASVYVSPNGNDANDGSERKPFATLAKARDAVRAIKAKGVSGAIGVILKSGAYAVKDTLALTAEDSGSDKAPVVYRAEKKGAAVLYGGARLSGFKPVSDSAVLDRLPSEARGKVMQCDLKALGITDYGEHKVRGFGQPPSPPTLELYCNGKPMTLARWPNEGFVPIKKLVVPGDKDKGIPSVIEYDDERHARWSKANDLWLFGYFKYLWADATIKIAAIDTAAKTLTSAESYKYGGTGMDTKQGIIYYAFNLLEEIDAPGEWYLDREAGMLYFYPPSDIAKATVEIGMLSVPMITMENVKNIRVEGITFDLARFNCMLIKDSERCLVAASTVKRFAGNGITILGGKESGILGCDIHTIGRRATEVIGGDRKSLTPGKHFVENCQIYFFGRIDRTYTPAVQLEGVGNRVAHNLMYDCPSSVMRIEGNDHIMEYNQVHSAVQESDDQGAMELFRNPTFRGVVFRYNHFYNNGKTGKEAAMHGQAAIRFDDAISGMLVYGNIFYRSANGNFGGVQMNSGRDNIMDNNIFADCKQGVSGGWNSGNAVWKLIREGKKPADFYNDDLYLSRYPAIKWMMDEPGINNVWRNVFYQCGRVVTGNRANIDMMENGVFTNSDPGFVNAAQGDFRLKPDAPLFASVGFKPIPVEAIGLYQDEYRATWPVATTPATLRDWRETVGKIKINPNPMAPIGVKKVASAPVIDGKLSPGEWTGATLKMKETPTREAIKGEPVSAKISHDGKNIYVAVRIPLADKAKMKTGATWGQSDGMEVCLRDENNLAVGRRSPTFVLQGFTGGQSQGAGNPEEEFEKETKALGKASRYSATIDDTFWIAEWAIPIDGMGIAYTPNMRLQFNIGVRRCDTDDWIALAGAMGANFLLDNAAVIILE